MRFFELASKKMQKDNVNDTINSNFSILNDNINSLENIPVE